MNQPVYHTYCTENTQPIHFLSLSLHIYIYVYWLVVLTTLKNISQFGRIIPYIMENKTCSKPPTSIYIYVYVYKLDSQRSACLNPKFSSPISAMLWVSPAWTASEQRTAETPTAVPNLGETALSPAAQNPWCLAYGFDWENPLDIYCYRTMWCPQDS